jgi:hypothetical protein
MKTAPPPSPTALKASAVVTFLTSCYSAFVEVAIDFKFCGCEHHMIVAPRAT